MDLKDLLFKLPYKEPFLFVDELTHVDDSGIEGKFKFQKESSFYKGHFKDFPVTPGVILSECCAQIGLVSFGLYLLGGSGDEKRMKIALTSSEMEFLKPVFPDETVYVTSEKVYFRFGKLKCKVRMINEKEELVCKGVLAGILKQEEDVK